MNAYVVWLDHEQAKFYELSPGGVKRDHINSPSHKQGDSAKFFHQVAQYLSVRAGEILLLGPGTAKNQFKHHLENHNHEQLAKRVVGTQSIDHPTDGEILNVAKKFFVHYDAFH